MSGLHNPLLRLSETHHQCAAQGIHSNDVPRAPDLLLPVLAAGRRFSILRHQNVGKTHRTTYLTLQVGNLYYLPLL